MGTVNVLEAVRQVGDAVRAVVVVTSDKCYENPAGGARRFVEGDPLGGEDPYSSSKACAELVDGGLPRSFFAAAGASSPGTRVASARAGNVIGGGDWGADRLIPDIVRAIEAGEPVKVRNPGAVRPWQHVLNPLSGYLALARELYRSSEEDAGGDPSANGRRLGEDASEGGVRDVASAWNFGPEPADARTVGWVVQRLAEHWDGAFAWEADGEQGPPEAGHLALDSSRAARELGWHPAWDLDRALESVARWHERLPGRRRRAADNCQPNRTIRPSRTLVRKLRGDEPAAAYAATAPSACCGGSSTHCAKGCSRSSARACAPSGCNSTPATWKRATRRPGRASTRRCSRAARSRTRRAG